MLKPAISQPEVRLEVILLYVFIMSFVTAPLVKLQEYFIAEATKQPWFKVSPFRPLNHVLNIVINFVYVKCIKRKEKLKEKPLTAEEMDEIIAAKLKEQRERGKAGMDKNTKVVPVVSDSDVEGSEMDSKVPLSSRTRPELEPIVTNNNTSCPRI